MPSPQVPASQTHYWLTSMVVYYGLHYSAFTFCEDLGQWIQMDDRCAKVVGQYGTWQEVLAKCTIGRLQPGLITYQRVDELELSRLESLQQQRQEQPLVLQQQEAKQLLLSQQQEEEKGAEEESCAGASGAQ